MIISASRRTDIPSFFGEWFTKRLREGFVYARNPFRYRSISKIPLNRESVDAIVFWTKDPSNFLEKLPEIDEAGFKYYFQFTLTPYGQAIEKNLRAKDEIVEIFCRLSGIIGEDRVVWRYDPVLISGEITVDYHIREFERLACLLRGRAETVIFSFLDDYKTTVKNTFRRPTVQEMVKIAESFSLIAKANRLKIKTCAEPFIFEGIGKASCIDGGLISKILGRDVSLAKDKNQRNECLCGQSVDIGQYDSCGNRCLYCYANHSDKKLYKNTALHDPNSPLIIGNVEAGDIVKERKE